MIFSWLRKRRRREWVARPFPREWQETLQANVRVYALLPGEDQSRLRRCVQVFVPEKKWVGCGGLEINDEIRVTIAAQACLLLLGVDEGYCFDDLLSILVYPDAYAQPPGQRRQHLVVSEDTATLGESWKRGPIVLSWADALHGALYPESGQLLVVHEFAHHVDGLDGDVDGTPPLRSTPEYHHWDRVVEHEYERLVQQAAEGRATLLDHYGASNRAEFFAVAAECFFGRPLALQRRHAELYDILRVLFRQDPARWPGVSA